MFYTKLKKYSNQVLLSLVMSGAVWVLLSWATIWITKVEEDGPIVGFSVGICFLFMAIVRIKGTRRWWECLLLGSVILISGASLLQYLLNFKIGTGSILWHPYSETLKTHPTKMALSTSLCLLMTSLTWVMHRRRFVFDLISVLSSTLVVGLASLNLISILVGSNSDYGWGSYSKMTWMSSLGFICITLVYLFQLSQDVRERYRTQLAFAPFRILMASLLVVILIWHLLVQKDQEANRRVTSIHATSLGSNIDRGLEPLMKVMGHLSRRMALGAYATELPWLSDAESYFNEFFFLSRLYQVDQEGNVKWIYPLMDGGRSLVGKRIGSWNPDLLRHLELIKNGQNFTISRIFQARSKANIFVFFAPAFQGQKYIGTTGATIYSNVFFDRFLALDNYDVVVRQESKIVYQRGSPQEEFKRYWGIRFSYNKWGVDWQVEVVPKPSFIRANTSFLPGFIFILGVIVSILLSLTYQFFIRSQRSEKLMKEVVDWKEASINSSPLLFISLDENIIIRELNLATEKLLGYTAEELVGKVSPLVFHDLSEVREYQASLEKEVGRPITLGRDFVEAVFERGYHRSSEWHLRAKDGRRVHVRTSTSRILDEKGETTGFLQILEDVTSIKEKERALEEQERKLVISSRLASLGEMVAGIAHEINNPLAILNGQVGVMKKHLHDHPEVDVDFGKRLETMETVIQRIAKIIKGLRSYVREPTEEALEEVTVQSIVEDSLTYCQDKLARTKVELELDLEPGLVVRVLPYQISQVILNLLNNAIDVLQNSELKKVTVSSRKENDGIQIKVTDTGPGVPFFMRSKIMEPFFTTKEVGKGVGLGLSICQGLIQGHHGKFYLDEAAEKTTFVIFIPRSSH